GAEDVADYRGQLDLGFGQFLGALLFPGPFLGQGAPVAGQVPQLALRAGRDERGPEHAPLGELGQPDRIELVFSELRNDHGVPAGGRCPDACRTAVITSWMLRWSMPLRVSRRLTGVPPAMLAARRSIRCSPPLQGRSPASSAAMAAA